MKFPRHALAALGLIAPSCSPAPAHRASAPQTPAASVPLSDAPGGAGPGAGEGPFAPSSPGPASTTTEAPVTVTITAPPVAPATTRRATTTTVAVPAFVLPEAAGNLTDDEWADRERILACIRSYEGDYGTETGNGHHGAYQFVQSTWDGVVGRAGYPQWVGRRAGDAPAHVQDDAAWLLYTEQSFGPWPPASRYCRGVVE